MLNIIFARLGFPRNIRSKKERERENEGKKGKTGHKRQALQKF